jgi:hypothetical protein
MKTIPIQAVTNEFSECVESGVDTKQNLPIVRREFLKGSGILMDALASVKT